MCAFLHQVLDFTRLSSHHFSIQTDDETHKAQVYYAKVPPDVDRRTVLLMYPILTHGITVIEAVKGSFGGVSGGVNHLSIKF